MRLARLVVFIWLALTGAAWAQCSVSNLSACPSPSLNTFTAVKGNFLGGAIVWSDSTLPRNFNQFSTWTGTSTNSAGYLLNRFQVNDQVTCTTACLNPGVGWNFEDDYGGTGSQGSKYAMNILLLQQNGANGDSADHDYVALAASAFARFTQPGSSSTNPLGRVFGANLIAQIQPGFTATNLAQVTGAELDVRISPGSSASLRSGLSVVAFGAHGDGSASGYTGDNAIWLYGTGAPWRFGFGLSDTQAWPIDDNIGTIIGANYGAGRNNPPDMSAMWGMNFRQVAFPATGNPYDGGFLNSNGFSVDGAGKLRLGTTYFASSSTGLTIDAVGSVGSGTATIATAGSGYETGVLVFSAYDGLWTVVTSGGVPTGAVTTLVQPVWPSTSSPPTTITPTNLNMASQGSGFQITQAWNTTATRVSLQPSGGPIIMAGLPTSAPTTHCQVWASSGVLTLTTCP